MSQEDYVIANQTFPAFRTDLNSTLDAILTSNSGASAPSTTGAYQIWADTTNNVYKRRNSGDSGWFITGTTDDDRVISKSGAYTVAIGDYDKTILCSTGSGFTVTLPAASSAGDGFKVTITKVSADSNTLTIDGDGSETINGATTLTTTTQYDSFELICDGSNWFVGKEAVTVAAGGSAGLNYIASATASASSTLDFVDGSGGVVFDSTYDAYRFNFIDVLISTSGAQFALKFSDDGGSTWEGGTQYAYMVYRSRDASSLPASGAASAGGGEIYIDAESPSSTANRISGYIEVYGPASSQYTKTQSRVVGVNSSEQNALYGGGGVFESAVAVDGIQFLSTLGTMTSGDIHMYGIAKS